jgi:hypothetical protein
MREFSESSPARSSLVIESSSTRYWAHRLLSERHNVTLSNPFKNKAIASAKMKTDNHDEPSSCICLARSHPSIHSQEVGIQPFGDHIPFSECAPAYQQPYSRFEDCPLSVFQGARQVQGEPDQGEDQDEEPDPRILAPERIAIGASPFSKGFVEELRKIENPRVQAYLRPVESLNREIREASITTREKAKSDPDAIPLMSIPGIYFFSALLIVSEIGEIGDGSKTLRVSSVIRDWRHPLTRREGRHTTVLS